jgi:hypothetical protein
MILKEFFLKLSMDYSKNKVIPKGLVWLMLSCLHPQTIQRHGKDILKSPKHDNGRKPWLEGVTKIKK